AAATLQHLAIKEDVVAGNPEIQSMFALFAEVSSGCGAAQAEHGGSADTGCQNRPHSGDCKAGQGASQTQAATGANHGTEKRPHALAHSIALGVGGRHMVKRVLAAIAGNEADGFLRETCAKKILHGLRRLTSGVKDSH